MNQSWNAWLEARNLGVPISVAQAWQDPEPATCNALHGTAVPWAFSTPPMMHSISGKTSSRPVWHPSPRNTKHDAQKGEHVLLRHSILLRRPGTGVSALICATELPCTHGRRMPAVGNKWRLKERQHDSGLGGRQCQCGLAGGATYSTQCRCGLEWLRVYLCTLR